MHLGISTNFIMHARTGEKLRGQKFARYNIMLIWEILT